VVLLLTTLSYAFFTEIESYLLYSNGFYAFVNLYNKGFFFYF